MNAESNLALALSAVMNVLNVMGRYKNEDVVVDTFRRTHRTLQQQFVKVVVIPVLKHLADSYIQGNYDDRNEKSAALAAKMLRAVTDEDLFLPLV